MKQCAVVCAAPCDEGLLKQQLTQHKYDCVIAVDAGLMHLLACDVQAQLALGDFDSLEYIPNDITVVTFPEEKDASDLGLALDWACTQDFARVDVYGALGARLDHTLATLQELARVAEKVPHMQFHAFSDYEHVQILVGDTNLVLSSDVQDICLFEGKKDARTVSLFALSDALEGVDIKGLKYELSNAEIKNRGSLGLSNELTGKDVLIRVKKGTAVLFLPIKGVNA